MNFAALVHNLRCSLLHIERRLLQAAGLDTQLGGFTDCELRTIANVTANHSHKLCPCCVPANIELI